MESSHGTAAPPHLLLRERQIRVLAVLPHYDPHATHGREEYVRRLVEGLAQRGVSLQVLTTWDDAASIRADGEAVLWPGALARVRPPAAPAPVRRFAAATMPHWLRRHGTRLVHRAQARRRLSRGLGLGYSYVAGGFHEIERAPAGFAFCWTGPTAHVQVDCPGDARDVVFELYCPGIVTLDIAANGRRTTSIGLRAAAWQRVEVPVPAGGAVALELRVRPTFSPRDDPRHLGVAVRSITVRTRAGQDLPVPLDRHRASLLEPLDTFRLAEQLEADGHDWDLTAAVWDAILKGPVSPSMALAAVRAARHSDVVLVAGTPYLTSVYGWLAARLARRPLVAVPLLDLRDPTHHRPWTRFVHHRACHVVAQGSDMARLARHRWGRPVTMRPGGVDPAELGLDGDGRRFRLRHGLGDGVVVLMSGPKNAASGYRLFCAAAEELRRDGASAQFVLAGHDEDGLPLRGTGVRYIGPLRGLDATDALDAADVVVPPLLDGDLVPSVLGAWLRGKPVVGLAGTDALRDLVGHAEDGLVASTRDEAVAALRRVVDDPALRERLGSNGRRKAVERFTWPQVVADIEELLHGIVAATGRS